MYCVKRNTTNILLRIWKLSNQESENRVRYLPKDSEQGAACARNPIAIQECASPIRGPNSAHSQRRFTTTSGFA